MSKTKPENNRVLVKEERTKNNRGICVIVDNKWMKHSNNNNMNNNKNKI